MNEAFQRDCIEILADKVKRGEMTRRRFAQLAAMLVAGAPLALRTGGAAAQAKQLVFVNWGGDAITAYDKAYGQPFLEKPESRSGKTVRGRPKVPSPPSSRVGLRAGTSSMRIPSRR